MNNFIKGALTGAVVGAALSMVVMPVNTKKMCRLRKRMNRTLRAASSFWDVLGDLRM